ncbi:hypothetical protein LXL04_008600 [Taraxacum kok-saghyz]
MDLCKSPNDVQTSLTSIFNIQTCEETKTDDRAKEKEGGHGRLEIGEGRLFAALHIWGLREIWHDMQLRTLMNVQIRPSVLCDQNATDHTQTNENFLSCFRKRNNLPTKRSQCNIMRKPKKIKKITRLTVPSKRYYGRSVSRNETIRQIKLSPTHRAGTPLMIEKRLYRSEIDDFVQAPVTMAIESRVI